MPWVRRRRFDALSSVAMAAVGKKASSTIANESFMLFVSFLFLLFFDIVRKRDEWEGPSGETCLAS